MRDQLIELIKKLPTQWSSTIWNAHHGGSLPGGDAPWSQIYHNEGEQPLRKMIVDFEDWRIEKLSHCSLWVCVGGDYLLYDGLDDQREILLDLKLKKDNIIEISARHQAVVRAVDATQYLKSHRHTCSCCGKMATHYQIINGLDILQIRHLQLLELLLIQLFELARVFANDIANVLPTLQYDSVSAFSFVSSRKCPKKFRKIWALNKWCMDSGVSKYFYISKASLPQIFGSNLEIIYSVCLKFQKYYQVLFVAIWSKKLMAISSLIFLSWQVIIVSVWSDLLPQSELEQKKNGATGYGSNWGQLGKKSKEKKNPRKFCVEIAWKTLKRKWLSSDKNKINGISIENWSVSVILFIM